MSLERFTGSEPEDIPASRANGWVRPIETVEVRDDETRELAGVMGEGEESPEREGDQPKRREVRAHVIA